MFPRPTSLRFGLLLVVLVALIPVLALTLFHAAGIRRQLQEERQAEAVRLAAQAAAGLSRYIEGTRQLLVALAHHEPIRSLRPAEANKILGELRGTSPLFANLVLANAEGFAVASAVVLPSEGITVTDRAFFQRLQANRHLGFGEYQIGRITNKPVINLACPLPDQPTTGPLACVIAVLDLSVLQEILDDFPRAIATNLVLLDRHGVVLAQRGTAYTANGTPFPGRAAKASSAPAEVVTDKEGHRYLVHYAPVPSSDDGLSIGVGLLESSLTHEVRNAFWHSLVATTLVMLAAMALAWWIAERLVLHPTRQIARTASALAAGEWTARARIVHGAAELHALGQTFDAMAEHFYNQLQQLPAGRAELVATRESLQQAMAAQQAADIALRRSEATARAFIDSITETALLLGPEGTVLMANQTAAERLGRPTAELLGTNIASTMSPKLFERRQAHLHTVLATRRPLAFDDERRDRILHTTLTPVLDASGQVAAIAVLSFDITERQRIEEQLRRSIAELERALSEVKTLSGLLPICAGCKKIRDDKGYWNHVEQYLRAHTEAEFSHGLCPDCIRRLYPEYADELCPSAPGTNAPASPPLPPPPASSSE